MKKVLTLALSLFIGVGALAQDLPQRSPAATTQQRVGLTDVKVEYSRPAVRGREIFGELVPFGKLWRTGANKATSISFSTDVIIGDNSIEKGTYSIFTIPNEGEWVVILNSETELWGIDGYDEANDVARITVETQKTDAKENFSITVENITDNSADIVFAWAHTSASLPIRVKTSEQAMANITKALEENPQDWRVYRNAANYYLTNKIDLPQAQKYMEKSLELNEENWYSHFLYATILAENGEKDDAKDEAEEALEMGLEEAEKEESEFNYAGMIQAFIEGLED
ncbi:MAG: DUF2911 domain-containing protein [Bacteroidetes bacterium]|nr:MAG: DUF2911 domain-containing protein [Bacteroidota bacterium]